MIIGFLFRKPPASPTALNIFLAPVFRLFPEFQSISRMTCDARRPSALRQQLIMSALRSFLLFGLQVFEEDCNRDNFN